MQPIIGSSGHRRLFSLGIFTSTVAGIEVAVTVSTLAKLPFGGTVPFVGAKLQEMPATA